MATVFVDGENVRRSVWPNIPREELEALARAWAADHEHEVVVVWETDVSADDWIVENAAAHRPYWLVTSDRELRRRAGGEAERVVGGGSFARELLS